MDMGFSQWMALESAVHGERKRRSFSGATLRRIAAFARPHRRALIAFLVLSGVRRLRSRSLWLGVMRRLSMASRMWAVISLALFGIAARRRGARLVRVKQEAGDHNAAMTIQITERFSAPVATLVKLFGRPVR